MTTYTAAVFGSAPTGDVCRHEDLSATQGVDIAKTALPSTSTMSDLKTAMVGFSQRELGKNSDMILLATNGTVGFIWCFYRNFANQKALSMWSPREVSIGGVVKVRWVNRNSAVEATTEDMLESVGYPVQGLIGDNFSAGASGIQALNLALANNNIFASCFR